MRRFAIFGLVAAGLSLAACDQVSVIADGGGDQLADRIAIEDMLTSYYSHFGTDANEDFAAYYTKDAVFDVNGRVAEGHEAIVAIYEGLGEPGEEDTEPAAEPAPAADPAPAAEGVFHMILSNVEVKVDGDTATATMFWTGVMNEDPFGPPRIVEQGREYDLFVRQDGKWLIKHRVVIADSGMPENFRETWQPRLDFDIKPKP